MRSSTLILVCAILISISFNSCNSKNKKNNGRDVPLGMLFEKQDKLAGIPLASTPFGGDELPAFIDMSDKMPPVGNQGLQQSCVAWAIAYALKSYQEKLELGQQYIFSPAYIYNQINNGQNAPTYVTDALNVLSNQGVCNMEDMPYDENDWTSKPTSSAKEKAKSFRIDFWRQVNVQDIKEVKAQLSAGYPVIIGAEVSKEFASEGFAKKADFIWSEAGTTSGGHCMLLVGYDDSKKAFKVMNSWGKDWGDNGYGWIDCRAVHGGAPGLVAEHAGNLCVGKRLQEAHDHGDDPDQEGHLSGGASNAADREQDQRRHSRSHPEGALPVERTDEFARARVCIRSHR